MTRARSTRGAARVGRPGTGWIALIASSIGLAALFSLLLAMALIEIADVPPVIAIGALLNQGAGIAMTIVGAVIEWQRPGHRIGRLMLLAGPLYAFLGLSWSGGGNIWMSSLDPSVAAWLNVPSLAMSFGGVALIVGLIPLLFPTGSLPSPRWRIPIGVVVGFLLVALVTSLTIPFSAEDGIGPDIENPIALAFWTPELVDLFTGLVWPMLVILSVGSIVGLVARYRRGDPIERLQIRWLAGAVVVCAAAIPLTLIEGVVAPSDGPLTMSIVLYTGILLIPIAIGIAVTRYRLYEIDRVISRTVGWVIVSGVLIAVFASLVIGLQALLGGVTQGETLAVAGSTLVAFALFQPLRRRVQRAVDHRFDRARYDADQTIAAFMERVTKSREVDLGELLGHLVETADGAIRPERAAVWLRGGDGTPG
jgi:hypothetical protein